MCGFTIAHLQRNASMTRTAAWLACLLLMSAPAWASEATVTGKVYQERDGKPGRGPTDQPDAHHRTATVDDQPLHPALQQDLRPTGRERARQQRVLRPRLRIDRAGEAHAHPAALARGAATVRLGVDQQGHSDAPPAEPLGRLPQ